jgi:hypothetical protein
MMIDNDHLDDDDDDDDDDDADVLVRNCRKMKSAASRT